MSDSSFSWASLRIIALVISLCLVGPLSAQPQNSRDVPPAPAAPAPSPDAPPSPADDSDGLKRGSHSSFTLTRQQSVIQCMEIVREAMGRSDYLAALPLMERILSEPNSFVPTGASTEVAAHEEVRRFLRKLPADLRQRLDEQRRTSAQRVWDQARVNGIAEVAAFVQQFGDLPQAIEAWWWLGCHERDHGKQRLAAAAFARIAEHPSASPRQRAIALVAGLEMLIDANQLSEAESVRERLTELDSKVVFGQSLTIGQWLAKNATELAHSLPHERSNTSHKTTLSKIASDRLRRPILTPIWKHPFATVPLGAHLTSKEQKQRDQGIRPIPIFRPLIVGEQVIVRTLDAIHALNQTTGDSRWTIPNTEFKKISDMKLIDNPAYLMAATEWAQRRTEADSIFARVSTDGQRLFVVQEPDRAREFRVDREFPRVLFRNGPQYNKLCGYSLDTGSLEWEIGGATTSASDTFGGCFFLGCPLVLDDVLYVIAQRETQMQLLAIDPANGSLAWSLTLGAALLPITEDVQRSRVACPIVWHDGLLLCSTSSGAVVAVDPLLRTLKWGYRYPATTVSAGDLLQGQGPADVRADNEPWCDLWREPFVAVYRHNLAATVGDRNAEKQAQSVPLLIFASPESDQLHAIRLPDGELAWRIPRSGGLIVAGILDDLVVVIEGDFIRAHEIATGLQRWRTMTGEISGPGAFVGSVLVLPAQTGGTILLNAQTGQLLSDSSNADTPLGALAEANWGWIASNRQSVMRLPRLDEVRRGVDLQLKADPDNESLRVRAAFLDLQAGDSVSARGRLDGLQSSPARELRREALIDALREPDANRSDVDRSELARQLKELAEDVDYKFAAGAAIGKSALAVVDLAAAVDAALDGLAADLDQPEALVKTSSVVVRKDRVLLGLIDEAYRRAKPADLPAMDELFLTRLKEARKSRDRLAVQRLAQQWQGLDWSRRLAVIEDEKVFRKRSPTEVELRLLDAAGSADRSIALQALEKLAQRFDRVTTSQEARDVRQRILRELPAATFPDGTTESERIARNAQLRESVFARTISIWPAVEPELESRDDRNFPVGPIVPMHAEPGSLAERLDVIVDRNGNDVLFRGESFIQGSQDENHERKLTLPPTLSTFRGPTGYMLRECWGVGRIVVLLVGSELFAISPLDDGGNANPRFLWSSPIELMWSNSPSDARIVSGRSGHNDAKHMLVDQTNRPIGRVGPVRAGYLCFQKGTKLVAVETESGRELWERLDLPADVTVLGDDHCVYLWRESKVLEVLSAVDGRKIEDRVWLQSPSSMIHQRGSLVWTVTHGTDVKVELHDLQAGQSVWSRVEVKNTQIEVLDSETLAMVNPDGQLHVLAARTGNPLCAPLTVNANGLSGIVVWKDRERWFVALTRPTGNVSKLKSLQPNDSYRLSYLKGTLYALDRDEPKILWQRPLNDEPIALDQSQVAPILVQLFKLVPKDDKSASQGMLRVIDKRTGKLIYERKHEDLQAHFLLNPDPQQAIVELKLARETLRLLYAPEPPVDAIEAIQRTSGDRLPD